MEAVLNQNETIDQTDAMLLNSTLVVLDQYEFEEMKRKYKGNRIMTRLLDAYAEKYDFATGSN